MTYFGPLNFPPELAGAWPFTVTRVGVRQLETLRGSGLAGFAGLVGGRTGFTVKRVDSAGRKYYDFSYKLWKQELLKVPFQLVKDLVRSGELRWVYAIDEPHDWAGGRGPTYEEIDAACEYVAQRWTGLKCGVNAPAAWLKKGAAKLPHLSFMFCQWAKSRGTAAVWLAQTRADAAWFTGDLFLSIQVLDPRLTPIEARDAAKVFAAAKPTGVMLWKWDQEWFAQTGAKEAMQEVLA